MSANSFWRWRRPTSDMVTRPETPGAVSGSAEAIISIFGDEEVSDVRLQGSDGGTVVAVKAILASRSPMLRQKFFGENRSYFIPTKPGDKEIVTFKDWDCRILHLIVEYCYTDNCSVMKSQPTEDIARLMALLRVATKTFKLPGLLDKIRQWVWRMISRHPALACAMIDEGMRNDDVDELALQTLQLKSRASLLPNDKAIGSGVLALSKPGLLFVMRTLEETTSHYLLLQALEQWVDFSSEGGAGDHPERERASREAFARKCAMRFIKLSKIPQENLDALLKRSRLFSNADGNMILLSQPSANFSTRALSPTPGRLSPTPGRLSPTPGRLSPDSTNLRNLDATSMSSQSTSARKLNLSPLRSGTIGSTSTAPSRTIHSISETVSAETTFEQ